MVQQSYYHRGKRFVWDRFLKAYHRFVKIRGNPHEVAWGLALGVFIGISPSMGTQMVIAVFLAALFKVNKISAMAGAWVTNPITAPFIYTATYLVGAKILGMEKPPAESGSWGFSLLIRIFENAPEMLWAMTIGGFVIGIPVAIIAYYLAFVGITKYQTDLKARLIAKKQKIKNIGKKKIKNIGKRRRKKHRIKKAKKYLKTRYSKIRKIKSYKKNQMS